MIDILFYTGGFILIISLLVIIFNLFTTPSLKHLPYEAQIIEEKISVLIPARNEEHNIEKCLKRVLQQDCNIHEVIILDDQSSDRTKEIVCRFAKIYPIVKVINGKPLPKGWLGKNWACDQLGRYAAGDLLLFMDADVELEPCAVRSAYNTFKRYNLNMLSVFPTQRLVLFGEWIIVPLMNWILLSFLPLKLVYSSKNSSFVAANGQFIMFDSKSYRIKGGHKNVASQIVEDMEMARSYKNSGFKIMTLLGNKVVLCRMYNSFSDAFNGFKKNFFAGFNMPAGIFFLFILLLFLLYFIPFILVFFDVKFIWLIDIILLSRIMISELSNQSILMNLLLHPVQMIVMFITGVYSIISKKKNLLIWKERPL